LQLESGKKGCSGAGKGDEAFSLREKPSYALESSAETNYPGGMTSNPYRFVYERTLLSLAQRVAAKVESRFG
jgi:hypothetical protein